MSAPSQTKAPKIPPPSQAELDAMERGRRIAGSRQAGAGFDTQAIDGAPGLITLAGIPYAVSQPSPMDLAAVIVHLKRSIKTPMQELKAEEGFDLLPADEQQVLLRDKARWYYANRDKWLIHEMTEALLSPEAVAFAFWIFCRKLQPTLALEEVRKHITEANAAQIFCQLDVESAMASLGNLAGLSG